MIEVGMLAVVVGALVRRRRRRGGGGDGGGGRGSRVGGAGLLLGGAAHLFPAGQRDWARALAVEVEHVPTGLGRWRFALGGVWAGVLAHGREPVPGIGTGVVLLGAAALGGGVYLVSPVTHVFGVALGVALALAGISSHRRVDGPVLLGVAACVALTLYGVAAYPAAADNDGSTAVFSLVLAGALGAYLWIGGGGRPVGVLLGAGWGVLGAAADHFGAVGLGVAAGAGLAGLVAAGVLGARLARHGTSERGLLVVGLRTGLGAGLAYFVAVTSTTYLTADWAVHDREVLAAFRVSGQPDLATYLVSDMLGGAIVALLLLPPLVLGAMWAGSAVAR